MCYPYFDAKEIAMNGKQRKNAQPTRSRRTPARRPRLAKYDPTTQPIWEVAEEIAATVPDSEWAKVPRDLAKNLHHYLHGAPKEEDE